MYKIGDYLEGKNNRAWNLTIIGYLENNRYSVKYENGSSGNLSKFVLEMIYRKKDVKIIRKSHPLTSIFK